MRDGVAEDGELEVLGHAWSSLLKVVILRCLCRLHFAVCAISLMTVVPAQAAPQRSNRKL